MALPVPGRVPGWFPPELPSGGETFLARTNEIRGAGHTRTASAPSASFGTGPHEGRDRCRYDAARAAYSAARHAVRCAAAHEAGHDDFGWGPAARDSGWGPRGRSPLPQRLDLFGPLGPGVVSQAVGVLRGARSERQHHYA
ncbi:hypothetical protein GCM10010252_23660 [Streptomyces aureoverticillatus]|nr:hypothetical protein GCM10010252_23660 [Streptomyces aureoverticillatus]